MADLNEWLAEPGQKFAKASRKRGKGAAYKKKPEDIFAEAAAMFLRKILGKEGITNQGGILWYCVETRAKRSIQEGAANKRRGCVSGCYDLDFYREGRAYKIELKVIYEEATATRKARMSDRSDDQKFMGVQYTAAGVPWIVAWTLPDIVAGLDSFGLPHRRVTF